MNQLATELLVGWIDSGDLAYRAPTENKPNTVYDTTLALALPSVVRGMLALAQTDARSRFVIASEDGQPAVATHRRIAKSAGVVAVTNLDTLCTDRRSPFHQHAMALPVRGIVLQVGHDKRGVPVTALSLLLPPRTLSHRTPDQNGRSAVTIFTTGEVLGSHTMASVDGHAVDRHLMGVGSVEVIVHVRSGESPNPQGIDDALGFPYGLQCLREYVPDRLGSHLNTLAATVNKGVAASHDKPSEY